LEESELLNTCTCSYNGYWVSFPGVKRPGCGVDYPPPSSAEVKERVELYLYSPSGPLWPVLGRTLPILYVPVHAQSIEMNGNIEFLHLFPVAAELLEIGMVIITAIL
jgi:hypothetical protein